MATTSILFPMAGVMDDQRHSGKGTGHQVDHIVDEVAHVHIRGFRLAGPEVSGAKVSITTTTGKSGSAGILSDGVAAVLLFFPLLSSYVSG